LAEQANAMGGLLGHGLTDLPEVTLQHPVQANISFPYLPPGTHARAEAAGAVYYRMPAPDGREAARFVASWSTTEANVAALLTALRP